MVASDIGPNREVVGPDQVCATEAEAATLIRRILNEPRFAQRLLEDQRRRRTRYEAGAMVARWVSLYGDLTRTPSAAPTRPARFGPAVASPVESLAAPSPS